MDFIEMMESPHKEFEMSKPNCKEGSELFFEWKGLRVRKYIGAVVVVNSAGVKFIDNGSLLPLCGMVTESEWTTILEKEGD